MSIAVEDADGALAGVVFDPMRGETWAATRDGAATLDGAPLRAPARDGLATALVATGFGYDAAVRESQARVVARLLPRCATCAGSAPPRSTSRGPPPAATTPTTSAASSTGTSPRAR